MSDGCCLKSQFSKPKYSMNSEIPHIKLSPEIWCRAGICGPPFDSYELERNDRNGSPSELFTHLWYGVIYVYESAGTQSSCLNIIALISDDYRYHQQIVPLSGTCSHSTIQNNITTNRKSLLATSTWNMVSDNSSERFIPTTRKHCLQAHIML